MTDPAIPATDWTIHGELTDDALAALAALAMLLDAVEENSVEFEHENTE